MSSVDGSAQCRSSSIRTTGASAPIVSSILRTARNTCCGAVIVSPPRSKKAVSRSYAGPPSSAARTPPYSRPNVSSISSSGPYGIGSPKYSSQAPASTWGPGLPSRGGEGAHQPALADPGLAIDQHGPGPSGAGLLQPPGEQTQLIRTADERRLPGHPHQPYVEFHRARLPDTPVTD
jgi:hypothetical protein